MMARVVLLLTFVALILGSVEVRSEDTGTNKTVTKRAEACYEPLGCFSNDGPFNSPGWPLTSVPLPPFILRTKFVLFTQESGDTSQDLDARYPESFPTTWTNFKARPTVIITIGFLGEIHLDLFLQEMKRELLIHGGYNVVLVDWAIGSLAPYTQAVANTRVVGAQIAELIKALIAGADVTESDFHLIGMSLGAHVAGYAGERIPGLGRITGLDPAGPYFEDTDKVVRLDETDAEFVDIIHSDATSLLQSGVGTRTPSGDQDFYPNLGHDQPGCGLLSAYKDIIPSDIIQGITGEAPCSHSRATTLFSESINSPCPFMAYPCASEEDFVNNRCRSCSKGGCARMGIHAKKNATSSDQRVKYFLTTGDSPPFCRYHFTVTIKLSAKVGEKQQGMLDLVIDGDIVTHSKTALTGKTETFEPGKSYTFYAMLPQEVGNVKSLTLIWKPESPGFIKSFTAFNSKENKSLFLDEIGIFREEAGVDARFCAGGIALPKDEAKTVSKKC